MKAMLIFGLGYTGKAIGRALAERGWLVESTGRDGTMAFDDATRVHGALARAHGVLSTIPPVDGVDPVLAHYGDALRVPWLGYLSSTGVYGDAGGAWVDETAPTGGGRRAARAVADAAWLDAGAHVFRLPGIYGPDRSAFERLHEGRAHRLDLPGQVFSRIHVEDIVGAVLAAMDAQVAPQAWNIADDAPCHQNLVIEEAARIMGVAPPPLIGLDDPALSPASRGFYMENRRISNAKARRLLGWAPRFQSYKEGLKAIRDQTRIGIST